MKECKACREGASFFLYQSSDLCLGFGCSNLANNEGMPGLLVQSPKWFLPSLYEINTFKNQEHRFNSPELIFTPPKQVNQRYFSVMKNILKIVTEAEQLKDFKAANTFTSDIRMTPEMYRELTSPQGNKTSDSKNVLVTNSYKKNGYYLFTTM